LRHKVGQFQQKKCRQAEPQNDARHPPVGITKTIGTLPADIVFQSRYDTSMSV
jgi:hypothetical protein